MTVTPDGGGSSSGAKKGSPPSWFVDIGEPEPLMSTAEIQAAIVRGEVPPGTLVWRLGMADWVPYEEVEEIQLSNAHEHAARGSLVTPVLPDREEPDTPGRVRAAKEVPCDTDPSPPLDADDSGSNRKESTARSPSPAGSSATGRVKSLWKNVESSKPPRPSLSPSSAPIVSTATDGGSANAASRAPGRVKLHDEKRIPLPSLRPAVRGVGTRPSETPSKSRSLSPTPASIHHTPSLPPRPHGEKPKEKRQGQQVAHPSLVPSVASTSGTASVPSVALTNARTNARTNALSSRSAPRTPADVQVPFGESTMRSARSPSGSSGLLPTVHGGGGSAETPHELLTRATDGGAVSPKPADESRQPQVTDAAQTQDVVTIKIDGKAAAAVGGETVPGPSAADSIESQESTGTQFETVTVVRRRLNALETRYRRVVIAVAIGAAVLAAVVTALVLRPSALAVGQSSAVPTQNKAKSGPAPTRATAETPTTSVDALPLETSSSPEASQEEEAEADPEDTAQSRASARRGVARSGPLAAQRSGGADTSATDPSGGTPQGDSKLGRVGDAENRPPAGPADSESAPPGKATAPPGATPGAPSPGTSNKSWKADDPGF